MAGKDKSGEWAAQIYEQILRDRGVTKIEGDAPSSDRLDEQPNFDVYSLQLNKSQKDYKLLMAGSPSMIALQMSMARWMDVMMKRFSGDFVKFEDWFEQWSVGFSFAINRTGTTGLTTNYPLRTVGDVPGWREDITKRPGYLEWKNPSKKTNINYRVIEYFPDKSNEDKSYVFTGNDREIINHIVQLEYEGMGGASVDSGEQTPAYSSQISFSGAPTVLLYFRESEADVEEGYAAIRAEIRFHLMDKSDDPDSTLPTLTNANVRQLAQRIQAQFVFPQPYRIHKGKETVSVKDKENGLESYVHCYNKSDGIEFYTKLYAAMGKTMDLKKTFHKTTEDSINAYPTVPPSVNVLGKITKRPRKRPVGYCEFRHAQLFLKLLDKPVLLCDNKGFLFSSVD